MNLTICKWGNSLAVRIPSELVRQLGLRDGDSLQAQWTVDGGLALRAATFSRRAFAAEINAARSALPLGTSVMDEVRQGARY